MNINLEALIKLRIKKGLTQEEMANALGFKTPSAYSKIESGNIDLKAKHLPLLATKLGMTVEELAKEIFFTEYVA